MHLRILRAMLPVSMAVITLAAIVAAPAQAQPSHPSQVSPGALAVPGNSTTAITEGLARQVASLLDTPTTRERLVTAALAGPTDLVTITSGTGFAQIVQSANQAVLRAKGLPATAGSLLQIRLADDSMRDALRRGVAPLIAATPTDDAPATITGYGARGEQVTLDPNRVPQRPVLMVEVNVAKAVPLGLQLLRETLASYGIRDSSDATVMATAGYWATMVTAVRLSDDKEPWHKGGAEIFCLVGGFGFDGHVRIDTVEMPYLDHDGTTYYPNQLIVHFNRYKYNLADVVMMEDDGGTNYLQLAQAIANALLYIVDGGAYTPLVNAILSAIPGSWWSDDPDYADSWYTLSTTTSGRRYGAAGNGWMDVVPYWVAEL